MRGFLGGGIGLFLTGRRQIAVGIDRVALEVQANTAVGQGVTGTALEGGVVQADGQVAEFHGAGGATDVGGESDGLHDVRVFCFDGGLAKGRQKRFEGKFVNAETAFEFRLVAKAVHRQVCVERQVGQAGGKPIKRGGFVFQIGFQGASYFGANGFAAKRLAVHVEDGFQVGHAKFV